MTTTTLAPSDWFTGRNFIRLENSCGGCLPSGRKKRKPKAKCSNTACPHWRDRLLRVGCCIYFPIQRVFYVDLLCFRFFEPFQESLFRQWTRKLKRNYPN